MRNTLAIAWREIRTYFTSPLAYVVIGVFLAISGYLFLASLVRFSMLCLQYGSNPYISNQLNINEIVIRPMFGTFSFFFLIMIPMISMRLLAEERRSGTAELLFTCPVTSGQVIVGKYLGAASLLALMMLATLSYPTAIFMSKGARPDMPPALVGYLGVLLLGLAFLAVGVLVSSLTDNQIVAAVGAFGALILLWVIGWIADSATMTLSSLMNAASFGLWERLNLGLGGPTVGDFLKKISVFDRSLNFRKGLVDAENVIFYLSLVFFSLFLTQRVVESRQWRG